jgi:hypothetical protein
VPPWGPGHPKRSDPDEVGDVGVDGQTHWWLLSAGRNTPPTYLKPPSETVWDNTEVTALSSPRAERRFPERNITNNTRARAKELNSLIKSVRPCATRHDNSSTEDQSETQRDRVRLSGHTSKASAGGFRTCKSAKI